MKNILLRWVFKKELDETYQNLNDSYRREMQKVNIAMEQNKKTYGLVKRVFYCFPNAEIVGIQTNKKGEELIIVINNDAIYLFGERYQGAAGLPRINFQIHTDWKDGYPQIKHIHIHDILMVDNNIGNGTIAMNALIKYAKKNNVKWINGELSSIDDDHADRRNHFYEKFGFSIECSTIRLEL